MVREICSGDHVSRYCSFTQHIGGRPLPAAFEIRDAEKFLSVNWIEYFNVDGLEDGMRMVREEFRKHHGMTGNGRFAVLNVGDVKNTIELYTIPNSELRIWRMGIIHHMLASIIRQTDWRLQPRSRR